MKINNLGYLIREGFRGIFLHGFMSFAAICITVACLLIVGSFSILVYNLDVMVQSLNQTSEIVAYIDSSLSDAEARSVGTKINALDNVEQAVFVTREEALEEFIAEHDNNAAFNGVEPEVLRHRYVVTLEDNSLMEQTDEQLQQIPGVAKTKASYELAEGFTIIQNVLSIASVALITMLLVISLLIISNTIKLAMYDRKNEIAIMKMVGATNSFIRLPFIVEGFTLGMIGAIIGFGLQWVLYNALVDKISSMDALRLFTFVPFETDLLIPMLITFGSAGLFVGIVGSWTSIRKFMDV